MSDLVVNYPLHMFLLIYLPQSQGSERTWADELDWMLTKNIDHFMGVRESIKAEGIREPVVIGTDDRLRDGHHRVCAAFTLQLSHIPVKFVKKEESE